MRRRILGCLLRADILFALSGCADSSDGSQSARLPRALRCDAYAFPITNRAGGRLQRESTCALTAKAIQQVRGIRGQQFGLRPTDVDNIDSAFVDTVTVLASAAGPAQAFLVVTLRLAGNDHDAEIRFDSAGALGQMRRIHKPL